METDEGHADRADTGVTRAFGGPTVAARETPDGLRLIGLEELGTRGVVQVETPEGTLAVGLAGDEPFAVSNVCRHQFAKLGNGRVLPNGCLQCPWHRAQFSVRTGEMVKGPQGRIFGFGPYSRFVQAYANLGFKLKSHPVAVRDGAIYLLGSA
jgi:nitrite reductase/ring-hydroxylating ferredoxin subunit